jgi:hypothetical protein
MCRDLRSRLDWLETRVQTQTEDLHLPDGTAVRLHDRDLFAAWHRVMDGMRVGYEPSHPVLTLLRQAQPMEPGLIGSVVVPDRSVKENGLHAA